MVGVEYILLHAQEPILYIIRKQQRQSPTQGKESNNRHVIVKKSVLDSFWSFLSCYLPTEK